MEKSEWIKAFNRLEKAVSRHYETKHKDGTNWSDDADDSLHHAWKQIMKSISVDGQRKA